MEQAMKYPNIIKEYFRTYRDRNRLFKSIFYLLLFGWAFLTPIIESVKTETVSVLVVIPMFLAVLAGVTHTCELPPMFYLLPGTKEQREQYLKRMLQVHVALPMLLCISVDVIALWIQPRMMKAVLLQLVTVFFITYCVGIVNDGVLWKNTAKAAYGQMGFFNGAIMVFSILASCIMILICSSPVSNMEFCVVLISFLVVYVPLFCAIRRRWRTIRKKLAVYELAMKEETW